MASHIEMKRVAEDAAAVRRMAAMLLALADAEWTDWEFDFLEHMSRFEGPDALSSRQREVLFDLRDRSELARDWRGISVARLIADCHAARFDLDEDDEAFIAGLAERRTPALRRGALRRLVQCAVRLGTIEAYLAPGERRSDDDLAA